jgi:hypothetical protein
MRRLAMLTCCLAPLASGAAAGQDSDWPCQQRLVPADTFGTFWSGPPVADGADWRADSRVAKLVDAVSPRDTAIDEGIARIDRFAEGLSPAERQTLVPLAFAGIVEATNGQRTPIIDRIEELAERQHSVADLVAKASAELDGIPADATGEATAARAEAAERRGFLIRNFEETQRTMRYVCEVPAQLDQRLGRYAEALQKLL